MTTRQNPPGLAETRGAEEKTPAKGSLAPTLPPAAAETLAAETAYDRLLDRLRDHGRVVTRGPGQASAQCPAHEDQSPSLSITRGRGLALVNCWTGCDNRDVMAALGLS